MPAKIDIEAAPTRFGTGYPEAFAEPCAKRAKWRLGDAAGLTQFGVNLLRLPAGQWSAHRRDHERELLHVGEELGHQAECPARRRHERQHGSRAGERRRR